MQSLLHAELVGASAADAAPGGPRMSRTQSRPSIWRRRPLRRVAHIRPAIARSHA